MYPGTLAWLGSSYTISATAAVLLGAGYAINIVTGPGTVTAIACGRAELDRDYNLIGLATNVVLSVILGLIFGAWGVVVATALGLAFSSGWLVRSVDRWLEIHAFREVVLSTRSLIQLAGTVLPGAWAVGITVALAPSSRLLNGGIAVFAVAVGGIWIAHDQLPGLRERLKARRG